jgi:hypothetical protein
MTISSTQQSELERPAPKVVYLMELQFVGTPQYLSTWNRNFTWDSRLWVGLGGLVSIGRITESESVTSSALSFNLNAADLAWISLAVGNDAIYRNRLALLYMCPIGDDGSLVDTPQLCWRGRMDAVVVGVNGSTGSISVKCETAAYAFKRRPTLRINAVQHRKVYPTDTGLDYLTDLLAKPQTWLSKRFQGK